MKILDKDDTIAVLIDYQEKFVPAINDSELVEKNIIKAIKGIKIFNIPIIVTQQYTKGLGNTINSISNALENYIPIDKHSFSCTGSEEFMLSLKASNKKTVILFGIEAHICVQQTAYALQDLGYDVYVLSDCVSSRNRSDCDTALTRMALNGIQITSSESALFELLRDSKNDGFKEIQTLVK